VDRFGERFLRRIFTDAEIAYAVSAPALTRRGWRRVRREGGRAQGVRLRRHRWRQIEVQRAPTGRSSSSFTTPPAGGPRPTRMTSPSA